MTFHFKMVKSRSVIRPFSWLSPDLLLFNAAQSFSLASFFYALLISRLLYCLKLTKGFTKIIKIHQTKKNVYDHFQKCLRPVSPDFWVTLAKELSFCHKLSFSNPYIFVTRWWRPLIFQTINSVRSNNHSLKYQRFTSSDRKVIGIRLFEFLAKTQFL